MALKPDAVDMDNLVAKVRADVMNESRIAERGYLVGDLQSQIKDFGPGTAAWEISYKTTSAEALNLGLKDKVAWEISYKTTSATVVGPDVQR
jgi:hypothetical protein